MLLKELISTCSHERVAEAAVFSIGVAFRVRIERTAHRDGLSVGAYAARAVRAFHANASSDEWHELSMLCTGQDMPILYGLRHILDLDLETRDMDVPCLRQPFGVNKPDYQVGAACG